MGKAHDLLPQELRETLPPLYSQKGEEDPRVYAKFFTPDAGWTWYVMAGERQEEGEDGQKSPHPDFIFFGYVVGLENEWGYFSLRELEALSGPLGLKIERDLYFAPGPWSEVREKEGIKE